MLQAHLAHVHWNWWSQQGSCPLEYAGALALRMPIEISCCLAWVAWHFRASQAEACALKSATKKINDNDFMLFPSDYS
jgi:hypothetical protein